ncbi:hypothetical protein A2966_00550 [Candidatus Roizmanbacteria bacterium RIFCSPLOWO2_01_FULL_41_22]|uniref:Peptidase S11 D-alanyl-D-alanine carboxypeptidase A N-terminal domain-containing protein n=1 Tax=Candidatus Roizmanbacteria bacterium RIFCSPLOWO2_01_FULL_41_22 TaxID=1802067 RepID=A0A1F7J8B8_9BACT|nr:MAG: hypothetical protein A2966_00550 [Candidatus Roizmanbacteria bacterium RIFCSPLOWO2_01_FULL_41_22]
MNFRFYFYFIFFSLLFLFYPGDSPYYHILAYNQSFFIQKAGQEQIQVFPVPYLKTALEPELTAEGVYIVDLPSFTPVFQRNSQFKLFPASTTKIITALVAIDIYKPDNVIPVKRIIEEGQNMGLVVGEKITVENLLYGLLVHSGNDAAFVLADHYGIDRFVQKMNEKAREIGMTNSYFTNPAGLDNMEQQTTAYDLALAGRTFLQNSYLKKIVGTKEIIISDVDYRTFHKLSNVNKLLGEIQGLGGLKTGYTEEAGENLVSFYKTNGHEYIIVILKSLDRFQDTKNAIQWIKDQVDYFAIDKTMFD